MHVREWRERSPRQLKIIEINAKINLLLDSTTRGANRGEELEQNVTTHVSHHDAVAIRTDILKSAVITTSKLHQYSLLATNTLYKCSNESTLPVE